MVILSSQRMQRLAARLQQMERGVERGGGEVEDAKEEATGDAPDRTDPPPGDDVEEDLEEVAARAGVELSTVRRMDAATLTRALARGPGGGGDRLWVAAEVLFVDGLSARSRGEDQLARSRWEKAAHLYRQLDEGLELPEGAAPPERRLERMEAWPGGG